jgi:hypothetical protein
MPAQAAGAPPDLSSGATSGFAKRSLSPIPRAAKSCCNRRIGKHRRHSPGALVSGAMVQTILSALAPIVFTVLLGFVGCVPKIRFCNIGDEGRREQAVM